MMDTGNIGDRHYIGYSGPGTSVCKDTVGTVTASYSTRYSLNIADQDDCEYKMELSFRSWILARTGKEGFCEHWILRIALHTQSGSSEWIPRYGTN